MSPHELLVDFVTLLTVIVSSGSHFYWQGGSCTADLAGCFLEEALQHF